MARRILAERNTRKLLKLANRSIAITLPIEFIRELGWREKQKVVVTKRGKRLVIEDWES